MGSIHYFQNLYNQYIVTFRCTVSFVLLDKRIWFSLLRNKGIYHDLIVLLCFLQGSTGHEATSPDRVKSFPSDVGGKVTHYLESFNQTFTFDRFLSIIYICCLVALISVQDNSVSVKPDEIWCTFNFSVGSKWMFMNQFLSNTFFFGSCFCLVYSVVFLLVCCCCCCWLVG